MSVTYSTASIAQQTNTNNPFTYTHTPIGTPKGILVFTNNYSVGADQVSSVTYGGVAMQEVVAATDTAGEPGNTQAWFLGSGIPEGTQTVSISYSVTPTNTYYHYCTSFNSSRNLDIRVQASASRANDQANPQALLSYGGNECLAVCNIQSGLAAPTDLTLLAGMSAISSFDFGQRVIRLDRQTTAGTTDFTIGYTAASDDVAFVAVALAEIFPPGSAFSITQEIIGNRFRLSPNPNAGNRVDIVRI